MLGLSLNVIPAQNTDCMPIKFYKFGIAPIYGNEFVNTVYGKVKVEMLKKVSLVI